VAIGLGLLFVLSTGLAKGVVTRKVFFMFFTNKKLKKVRILGFVRLKKP